jgi:DNA repair exonuclease SbcCD ATPase subunit
VTQGCGEELDKRIAAAEENFKRDIDSLQGKSTDLLESAVSKANAEITKLKEDCTKVHDAYVQWKNKAVKLQELLKQIKGTVDTAAKDRGLEAKGKGFDEINGAIEGILNHDKEDLTSTAKLLGVKIETDMDTKGLQKAIKSKLEQLKNNKGSVEEAMKNVEENLGEQIKKLKKDLEKSKAEAMDLNEKLENVHKSLSEATEKLKTVIKYEPLVGLRGDEVEVDKYVPYDDITFPTDDD